MQELTVSAGLARGLIAFAVANGADQRALTERAGIDPVDLEDQDDRIPFESYVILMRTAQRMCDDPALALHYGESVDMSEVSIVGLIMNAAETMLDAFIQLQRYGRLALEVEGVSADERFQVAQRDDQLWIVDARANPNEFPELTEGAFTRLVCGPRRFLPRAHVLEVHVTHSPPAYHAEYERIFQCPVTFASHWNALRMEPSVATWRVSQQPRYVFGVLPERGDALLQSLDDSRTTRGRVERLLLPILPTGGAKAETIASALGFSRQTLFRRLKAEGVTYAQVLDDLRHRMAAPLPEWQKDLRQRDGLSCRLLGSSIVFPRLQALDRDQPTGGAQDSGITKRGLAPQVGRAA